MREDNMKSRLISSLERVPTPSPQLDDVVHRARAVRAKRYAAGLFAGLIALAGVVLPLSLLRSLDGGQTDDLQIAAAETTLEVSGIQVSFPETWSARAYYISGYTRPVVRIANFELPAVDDVIGTGARSQMREDAVIITLTEYSAICPPCAGFDVLVSPPTLEDLDFAAPFDVWNGMPPQAADVPGAHEFGRQTFEVSDRFVDLWVEFGSKPAPESVRLNASAILDSIVIGPYVPPMQPDGTCNEWSPSKDRDCPANAWLRTVLAGAGFTLVDDASESTLVARGGGARFFAWVAEADMTLEDSGRAIYVVVDGITVFGDETELVWESHGFHVWVAPGPFDGDAIPDIEAVRTLVRMAEDTPFLEEETPAT